MALDNDNLNSTDINYQSSYAPKNEVAGNTGANDIMDSPTKQYMMSLAAIAATPKQAQTTNEDYYPGGEGDRNVIKGYYEGSILGRMPLVANNYMFPFAAMDKKKEQEKMQQQAKDNLYMLSLQQNYAHIKDAVQDKYFGEYQFQTMEDARKKYTDKLGDFAGTIAFRNSNDYKLMTSTFNGLANTFNDDFDTANQVIAEYQSGGGETKTEKETTKKGVETGDEEKSVETNSKFPEHYISESTYNAAQKFRYGLMNKGDVDFNDVQKLAKYKQELQMGMGLDKAASPVAATLSKDASDAIGEFKEGTTAADKAFIIKTQTGSSVTEWAYQTHKDKDGKTVIDKDENGENKTTSAFDSLYKQWSYAPNPPSKDDVVEHIKKLTTSQTKDKLEQVATDNAAFEKNEIARKKEERESKKDEAKTVTPETDKDLVTGGTTQKWDLIGKGAGGKNIITPINTGLKGALIVSYLNTNGKKETKIFDNQEIPAGSDYIVNTYNEETNESTGNIGGTAYVTKPGLTDQAEKLFHMKNIVSVEARVPYSVVKSAVESSGVKLTNSNQGGMVSPAEQNKESTPTTLPSDPNN